MKEEVYVDKLRYEKEFLNKGYNLIAGVDEVGRGPLAGPVVCCAVIMPLDQDLLIDGVDDSKKISEKKRIKLAEIIKEKAIAYAIYQIEPDEIDAINILEAVKLCMAKAVESLPVSPDAVLVDGNNIHIDLSNAKSVKEHCYIVKGDANSYTIGCASIVAKVYRDKLMEDYAKIYPVYGFDKHKGYGTKSHIDAVKENGPCIIHRKTFIKNFWGK
jgi:ribonuclease HII